MRLGGTDRFVFQSLFAQREDTLMIKSRNLPLKGWKRHILGFHVSEHGTFEVEALSTEEERVDVVLLSHSHSFYGSPIGIGWKGTTPKLENSSDGNRTHLSRRETETAKPETGPR